MKPHFSQQDSLGDLVARHPALGPILERLGLDYCCGGSRTLGDAARAAGRDPAALVGELEAAMAGIPETNDAEPVWAGASLSDLADHIEGTHHAYLREALPRVTDLLARVRRAHDERHWALLAGLEAEFNGLRGELEMHLMKEERVLFPLVRDLERFTRGEIATFDAHCGSVRNPIRQMEHEHTGAGGALARMRELTGGYAPPPDACPTFRALYEELRRLEADLHRHIHLENNILFPGAIALETVPEPSPPKR